MRTLNLGTTEAVEGSITDLRKNDLNEIKDLIELAVTHDDIDVHPDTGWTLRDTVQMIGFNTVIAGKSHEAVELGIFKLWGHWVNGPEDVYLMIGKFRVV